MIRIERLTVDNFDEHSLNDFDRRQEVHHLCQIVDGKVEKQEWWFSEFWGPWRKKEVTEALMSDHYVSFVALDDNRVIGFAGLKIHEDHIELEQLHVARPYRHQGIGRKLFDTAMNEAASRDYDEVVIKAFAAEDTIAFYQTMGVQLVGNVSPFDIETVYKTGK